MERRDLLRVLASAAALSLIPDNKALAAWTQVSRGAGVSGRPNGLNDAQMALVRAAADTIIPRTDTPSATDVGTHEFVDVIFAEYASDEDRNKFVAGLEAIDKKATADAGAVFAELSPEARGKVIEALETGSRDADPAQTWWRLKGVIIHGYFTSEPVMKDVLKTQIMFTTFQGSAPVSIKRKPSDVKVVPSGAGMGGHLHG